MNNIAEQLNDIDEVQRCREVRRALERTHRTLDGLCAWLDKMDRDRKHKASRRPRASGRRHAGKSSIASS